MTNQAAVGYVILAARRLGYTEEQIKLLEIEILNRMDWISEDFAEQVYRKS